MPDHLELLPAVDIKGGQAVQGIDGSEKRFGDPVEAALRWQASGAEWIQGVGPLVVLGRLDFGADELLTAAYLR